MGFVELDSERGALVHDMKDYTVRRCYQKLWNFHVEIHQE